MRHLVNAVTITAFITMSAPLVLADDKVPPTPSITETKAEPTKQVKQNKLGTKRFNVMAKLDRAQTMTDKDLDDTKGAGWVGYIMLGSAIVCSWSVDCLQVMVTDPACNYDIIC